MRAEQQIHCAVVQHLRARPAGSAENPAEAPAQAGGGQGELVYYLTS